MNSKARHQQSPTNNRCKGMSLIAVLFILVVLGGLATVMAQLGATQHVGYLLSKEGTQGYYASRSGLEWLRHEILGKQACPDLSSITLNFADFDLSLTCEEAREIEGEVSFKIFHLTSQAEKNIGTFGSVNRITHTSVWMRSSS